MRLNSKTLKLARREVERHIVSDLNYTAELYQYMRNEMDTASYLASDFGFKKFLNDYGVGRTLKAGDEAKMKILSLLKDFQFGKSHVHNISAMAKNIQLLGLSSNSGTGGAGLPQSFCSKFLYVHFPDQLIPYDSYVLKSLQSRTGLKLKDLDQYYTYANQFRLEFFADKSDEVKNIRQHQDKKVIAWIKELQLDPDKLFSWKLADKYLWCEEFLRRKKQDE